jgi:crotonobetainyl-CoA:carnitine CoA-transferase CaiB-like acyl-CoA transferase
MSEGLLDGVHVIELAQQVAGPYCGKLLADLGAEVIKVEPTGGDSSRREPPFKDRRPGPDRSGLFLYLNANKFGVTLNLERVEALDVLRDLLATADVLIHSYSPAESRRLGLEYQILANAFPQLVVTCITPYGQSGPRRDWLGTELTLWNASGYGVLTPAGAREEEEPPLHPHCAQVGYLSGANAAGATMAALLDRDLNGAGQMVDISEQETMIAALSPQLADYFYDGNVIWSRDHPRLNTMRFLPCKDGYVSLLLTQPDQWDRLQEWMGNPDWLAAIEYRGTQGMTQNWDVISFMLSDWFSDKTKEEIFTAGQARHIPIGPVNSISESVESPHLAERGFFVEVEQPGVGTVRMPGAPYRFSGLAPARIKPAPSLGQHNDEIYGGRLRYDAGRLRDLAEATAI